MRNSFMKKSLISLATASLLTSSAFAGLADFDVKLAYEKNNYAVTGSSSNGILLTISALDENGAPATTFANGTLIRGNEDLIKITSSLAAATGSKLDYNITAYGHEGNISENHTDNNMSTAGIIKLTKGGSGEISGDGRIRLSTDYSYLYGFGDETITISAPGGVSKSVPVTLQPYIPTSYVVRADASIDIDPTIDNNRLLSDLKSTNRNMNQAIPHTIKGVKTAGDSITVTVVAVDKNSRYTAYTADTTKTVYAVYNSSSTYTIIDKQDVAIVDGQGKATFTITKGDENRSITATTADLATNVFFTTSLNACDDLEVGDTVTYSYNSKDDNISYLAKPVNSIAMNGDSIIPVGWNKADTDNNITLDSNTTISIKFLDEYGNKVIPTTDDVIDFRFEEYDSSKDPEDNIDYRILNINGVNLNTSIVTTSDLDTKATNYSSETNGTHITLTTVKADSTDGNYTYYAKFTSPEEISNIIITPRKDETANDIDDVKIAVSLISGGELKNTLTPTLKAVDVNSSSITKFAIISKLEKDASADTNGSSDNSAIIVGNTIKVTISLPANGDINISNTVSGTTLTDEQDDTVLFDQLNPVLSLDFSDEKLKVSKKGESVDNASYTVDINLTRTVTEESNKDIVTYSGYFVPWTDSYKYELKNMKFLGYIPLSAGYISNTTTYDSATGKLAVTNASLAENNATADINITAVTSGKVASIKICEVSLDYGNDGASTNLTAGTTDNNLTDPYDLDGDSVTGEYSGIGTDTVTITETFKTGVAYTLFDNETTSSTPSWQKFLKFYDEAGNTISDALTNATPYKNTELTTEINGATTGRANDFNVTFSDTMDGKESTLTITKDSGVAYIKFPNIVKEASATQFNLGLVANAGESIRIANSEQLFYVGIDGKGREYDAGYTIQVMSKPDGSNVKIYDTHDATTATNYNAVTNMNTVAKTDAELKFDGNCSSSTKKYFTVISDKAGDVVLKVINQDAYTTAPDLSDSEELTVTFADSSYVAVTADEATVTLAQNGSVQTTVSNGNGSYSVVASSGLTAEVDDSGVITITADSDYDVALVGTITVTDNVSSTEISVNVTEVAVTPATVNSASLTDGWNLISNNSNKTLDTSAIGADVTWSYANTTWTKNDTAVAPMQGFWAKTTGLTSVEFANDGTDANFDIAASAGWTLAGTKTEAKLTDLKGDFANVFIYSNSAWLNAVDNVDASAVAGAGYWVQK